MEYLVLFIFFVLIVAILWSEGILADIREAIADWCDEHLDLYN